MKYLIALFTFVVLAANLNACPVQAVQAVQAQAYGYSQAQAIAVVHPVAVNAYAQKIVAVQAVNYQPVVAAVQAVNYQNVAAVAVVKAKTKTKTVNRRRLFGRRNVTKTKTVTR